MQRDSQAYRPFAKSLDEVLPENLTALRSVEEGWFVEYKSRTTAPEKIAKSISSFSNGRGGWLFFGVSEGTGKNRRADSFPGISRKEIPALEEAIERAVSAHVNPKPLYSARAVWGPCAEIGLAEDCAILVVVIPPGSQTPYVSSDGRIYRRVGSSAEPVPETDRNTLDELWKRSERVQRRVDDFLNGIPDRILSNVPRPVVHLHFLPESFLDGEAGTSIGFERFSAIAAGLKISGSVPYPNTFTAAQSFIARQPQESDIAAPCLTFRYDLANGAAAFSVPLSWHFVDRHTLSTTKAFLRRYKYVEEFTSMCIRRVHAVSLVDLNALFFVFADAIAKYRIFRAEEGDIGPFRARIRCENVRNAVPYLDTRTFVDFVQRRGFPVVQDASSAVPAGTAFDGLLRLKAQDRTELMEPRYGPYLIDAIPLLSRASEMFGVPGAVLADSEGEIVDAAFRAGTPPKDPGAPPAG